MSRIPLAVRMLLCALMVTQLSACSNARFAINRAKNLTWNTPSLNQTECPKLDGVYEEVETIVSQHLVGFLTHIYDREFERENRFSVISYQPHPDAKTLRKFFRNEIRKLGKGIVLELRHVSPFILEAHISTKSGKPYWTEIYRFEKSAENFWSGCYQNALIIRRLGFSGPEGNHFVTTTATETHFTKLPNGDLQVSKNIRTLYLETDIPRIENTVEIFKLYKPAAP